MQTLFILVQGEATLTHRLRLIRLIAVLSFMLLGCATSRTTDSSLQMIDVEQANGLIAGKSGFLGLTGPSTGTWVDPRTEAQFASGHIPGAINLPYASVRADHERLLKGIPLIIVYGSDYNDPVAIGMSKTLMELGHDDVRTLRGGLREWTAAGYELETSAVSAGDHTSDHTGVGASP
jgi:rhodanese-related sulfurtransferase